MPQAKLTARVGDCFLPQEVYYDLTVRNRSDAVIKLKLGLVSR